MLTAYVLHLFNVAGGGERVSLEIARALRSAGIEVVYVTNSASAMKKIAERLGLPGDYEVIEADSLLEKILGYTGRFVRYRRLLLLEKATSKLWSIKEDNRLLIDTGLNVPVDVDTSYIHYPVMLPTSPSSAIHWRLYNWLVEHRAKKMLGRPKTVLTNSTWTAKLIKEIYGIDAEVLYPPVDVEYFSYDGRQKEKVIATISRYTPEKNLELLPSVAAKVPDYDWYLVGSTGERSYELDISNRVAEKVKEEIKRCGARNFHMLINAQSNVLRELLQRATFYVHPQFAEHFGIAVVEAMSAGCIPLVYRDGGAWTDIVSPISAELGYSNLGEVPKLVRDLEAKEDKTKRLKRLAVERSREFSPGVFRERFIDLLRKHGLIKS
ncbi:MAG: glycosyltransferase [Desulfurococcaceae archaeon]